MLDAGVVDDDVDLAELAAGVVGHGADGRGAGQVGGRVAHPHAVARFQLVAQAVDGVGLAEAVEQHVGALFGEGAGDAEADAAG